jgi:hypothetical protein
MIVLGPHVDVTICLTNRVELSFLIISREI